MFLSLKTLQDIGNQEIKIAFFTSPLSFSVNENTPEQYLVSEDIEVDSKSLLQFSMNCSSDRKDFYFMDKHIFSLENSLPVDRIWMSPKPGFETKHFMVSEGKKYLHNYIALAHHLRSIINSFLVMFDGVSKEFVIDEKVSIPTTMTGGLKSFKTLRYLPNYSMAMQIYLSTSKWTMGYLPIQFYKVNFQFL